MPEYRVEIFLFHHSKETRLAQATRVRFVSHQEKPVGAESPFQLF